jgi:hypothetical protein
MAFWRKGDSLDAVATPTDADVAFFAGFFEGEGSCGKLSGSRALSVDVRQKDPEMLYRMRDLWGGSVKFSAVRDGKPSPTFQGYESWKNPIFSWRLSGDRARNFLSQIYPFLSSRRQAQVAKIDLRPTGRIARQTSVMSPEREALRSTLSDHEKYLESKAHHRVTHLEHCRQKDRQFQRSKFGFRPRRNAESAIVIQ